MKRFVLSLDDVPGVYALGEGADAPRFEFVKNRRGHRDAMVRYAADENGATDRRKLTESWWGELLTGWSGLFDAKGAPIPFETPPAIVEAVRSEPSKRKLSEADVRLFAGYRWRYSVVAMLPLSVSEPLELAIAEDEKPFDEALGNSGPSSVNG